MGEWEAGPASAEDDDRLYHFDWYDECVDEAHKISTTEKGKKAFVKPLPLEMLVSNSLSKESCDLSNDCVDTVIWRK